jgi:hypothetical protein
MKFINKHRINLFASMITAFIIVLLINNQEVFISNNSPQINPLFIDHLKDSPSYAMRIFTDPFGQQQSVVNKAFANAKPASIPSGLPIKTIAHGVYAAENPGTGRTTLIIKKGAKVTVTIKTLPDGREVKVFSFEKNGQTGVLGTKPISNQ